MTLGAKKATIERDRNSEGMSLKKSRIRKMDLTGYNEEYI